MPKKTTNNLSLVPLRSNLLGPKYNCVLCSRSLREGLADVRRQAGGEEEDANLQVQPQPHLQRHLRVRRALGANQRLRSRRPGTDPTKPMCNCKTHLQVLHFTN